jgi:L-fuculose-phosphate aldolase
MTDRALREELIATALTLRAQRVLPATLGNLSVRLASGDILITPSSCAYESTTPADLPVIDLDGKVRAGDLPPSSEWRMHTAIYRARCDVAAVVHTHAPAATALACLRQPLPGVLGEVEDFAQGPVRVAAYAESGTAQLAANVVSALGQSRAALIASHGMVAVGPDCAAAAQVAEVIEHCAMVHLLTRAVAG